MSDPQYGNPEDRSRSVDDVVGRVNDDLAEAEAYAGRASDSAPTEVISSDDEIQIDYAAYQEDEPVVTASEPVADAALVPPVARVSEPAVAPTVVAPAVSPQPIFVQAPEAPLPRGNRAAAGAIGILAALSFAVLLLGAILGISAIEGKLDGVEIGSLILDTVLSPVFWVPVAVFFVAFWLLGAIINRGRWGHWVVFGILVGAASYGGFLLGQLINAPFWELTSAEGATLVEQNLFAPLAIACFVFGRELTIWFGAWVAKRGKRVTELNIESLREYERTLEAGPQLAR